MGNYNSHYENYYNAILNKRSGMYRGDNKLSERKKYRKRDFRTIITRRIIQELTGALLLMTIVLGCRMIVTPKTTAVLNYCNRMIYREIDYEVMLSKIGELKYSDLQEKMISTIEKVRCTITGGKTIKESINENFQLPVSGEIISSYGEEILSNNGEVNINKGIDIISNEDGGIKASFRGTVKTCGETEVLGKFIIIDHGGGVETMYSNLNEINIFENDKVEKSQVIGSGIKVDAVEGARVHFELLYMGENKNPEEYIAINNNWLFIAN